MADLTQNIIDAATAPAEAENEVERVKARSIDEMIKADAYAKSQAVASGWGATRPARVVPPGSIGPSERG